MPINLSVSDLIEYTDWERQQWYDWLRQHGDGVLEIGAGPHGDGRFGTVGELVRHISSAEKRYVDRLSGRPLTMHVSFSVIIGTDGRGDSGARVGLKPSNFRLPLRLFAAEGGCLPCQLAKNPHYAH
jgi:hypothetical protein